MLINTTTGYEKLSAGYSSYKTLLLRGPGEPFEDVYKALKNPEVAGSSAYKSFVDADPKAGRQNGFWSCNNVTLPEGSIVMVQGRRSTTFQGQPGKSKSGYFFMQLRSEAAMLLVKSFKVQGSIDVVRGRFDILTPHDLMTRNAHVDPAAIQFVRSSSKDGNELFDIKEVGAAISLPKSVVRRRVIRPDGTGQSMEIATLINRRKVRL